ncbi:tRNA-dependent cyclodipeptide synthase [Antrihabitans spumae]|uniref:Cyclodipeptide synthase n=1 Tax=Antrihabitans spumae TaxID=3373370 RepID=A0ABW7JYV9_9NOCA
MVLRRRVRDPPKGPPLPFQVQPLSLHCHAPLTARAHVCFGISPFNSFFTTERIARPGALGLGRRAFLRAGPTGGLHAPGR